MHSDYLSIQGPVERRDNRLVLRVPVDAGGHRLWSIANRLCVIENSDVIVLLPDWLTEQMHLEEGSEVHVDDRWGRLNIARLN